MPSKRGMILSPVTIPELLMNTPTALVGANVLGKIIMVTSATEQLLGWTEEELLGQDLTVLMPERLRAMHKRGFKRWVQTGNLTLGNRPLRATALHKDGRELPVELTLGSFTTEDGDQRVIGMIRDIREYIEVEKESERLRLENNFVRSVTNGLGEGVIAIDTQGKITLVNKKAEEMLGYTELELLGQTAHTLIHAEKPDGFYQEIDDCPVYETIRTEKNVIIEDDWFKRKDGTFINVKITGSPVYRNGHIAGAVDIFIDIAKQKKEQEQLEASEKKYRDLVALSPDAIILHLDGKFIFANQACLDMMKAESFEQIKNMSIFDFILPEYHKIVKERLSKAISGFKLGLVEEAGRDLEGNIIPIEVATMFVEYEGKAAVLTIIRDISTRKEAIKYNQWYEAVWTYSNDMIALIDTKGIIMYVNPACEKLLGYTQDELIGMDARELAHPDERIAHEEEQKRLEEILTGKRTPLRESRVKKKDGTYIWTEGSAQIVPANGIEPLIIASSRDITWRKEREKEIEQLLNEMPQLIWLAKPDGTIYWHNQQWKEYVGEQNLSSSLHPSFQEDVQQSWSDVLQRGVSWQREVPIKRKDNGYRWFLVRANPIKENGEIIRWVGTSTILEKPFKG